jgi:hypothetical protein
LKKPAPDWLSSTAVLEINLISLLHTIFFVGLSLRLQYVNTAALCRLQYGVQKTFSASPI